MKCREILDTFKKINIQFEKEKYGSLADQLNFDKSRHTSIFVSLGLKGDEYILEFTLWVGNDDYCQGVDSAPDYEYLEIDHPAIKQFIAEIEDE